MAEPLRKPPSEEEKTIELEITPGAALPGTTPAFDEAMGREMRHDTLNLARRTAESLGSGIGKTVSTISSSVRSGLDVVSERSRQAGETLTEVADKTRVRAQDFALAAGLRARDIGEAAIYRAQQTRREVRRFADQRPLEAVVSVAAAAFAVGLALRIWRSNRG